ncbi:MAG: insulinase family protein [Acidimicrobiia bacterium]|nr:insulinase family protein [Acidimicrobiia bacterium]
MRFIAALPALLLFVTASVPAQTFTVAVDYFKLDNGLKVVVSTDRSAPVVLVEVIYNIGFRVEPKGRTGFAHLFEHMMFQGSANVKKMQHVALIQEAGGIVNGSTRFDYTNYFQSLPSNGLERALFLEADRMRSLDVTAENLKNQQNVVSEEVRVNVLNQPHGAFDWIEIWEKANTNWHNAHDFYGALQELEAATIEDVRAFFKTYYAPNNAVLVVSGDTTAAEVRRLAEKHFGSIPMQPQPAPADLSEPPQTAPKSFTRTDKLARTPAIAVAWHLPPRMTRDFFALSVLDPLLNSDDSARMYRKLVREDRLAMSSQGGFNFLGPNWDMKGPMLYTMRVDYFNDKTAEQVVAAIESVLDDVRKNGITAAELAQAKTTMRSSFLDDMEAGGMPLFGRSNLLGVFALFDDDPGRITTILPELEKVTLEDVKAAANRWFVPANRTSLDSRPAAKPTGPPADLSAVVSTKAEALAKVGGAQ